MSPPVDSKNSDTLKTLPGDDLRQVLWQFENRYDLQMLVQSARSVARGIVAQLVAGGARNRFHQNLAGTVADLAGFLHPQLVVMDAVRVLVANGPTGGNLSDVRRKDTVAAGVDQVAMDACGAAVLGLRPAEIGCISEAHSRGLGTMDFQALAPAMLEL